MIKRIVKAIGAFVYVVIDESVGMLGRIRGKKPNPNFTILYYHAVRAEQRRRFERQMRYLATHAQVVSAGFEGPFLPGQHYVAITFDDAFVSVAHHATPILQQHSMPFTVFVPTGCTGQHPKWDMEPSCHDRSELIMSETELQQVVLSGCLLGSHTVSHSNLTSCDDQSLRTELQKSLETVSGWIGGVSELACPYGAINHRIIEEAQRVGYHRVYSIRPQNVCVNPAAIQRGRTAVDPDDSFVEFVLKARGGYVWWEHAKSLGKVRSDA